MEKKFGKYNNCWKNISINYDDDDDDEDIDNNIQPAVCLK
jgi:hypothetical protein